MYMYILVIKIIIKKASHALYMYVALETTYNHELHDHITLYSVDVFN